TRAWKRLRDIRFRDGSERLGNGKDGKGRGRRTFESKRLIATPLIDRISAHAAGTLVPPLWTQNLANTRSGLRFLKNWQTGFFFAAAQGACQSTMRARCRAALSFN